MAIEKWKNKDGTMSYLPRVRDVAGKKFKCSSFKTLAEAKHEEARLIELASKAMAIVTSDAKKVTLAEYWSVWSVENRGKVSSGWKISQDQMFRDYIAPVIGKHKMSSIKVPEIGKVLNEARDKHALSEQTQKHIYSLLRKMFADAIEYYEMLAVSPVRSKFHRPDVPVRERPFLLPVQAFRLLEEVKHSYLGPAIWLQVLSALRPSEVQALRWRNVQFDLKQILICAAFNNKTDKLQEHPKQDDWGYAPMPPMLIEYLKERQGAPDEFVAQGPKGGMLSYETYCRAVPRTTLRLGLPRITPHELRHSCTEIYVQAGASAEDVRRLLNQGSLTATARYIHRTNDRVSELATRVGPGQLRVVSTVSVQKNCPELDGKDVCRMS